MSLMNCIASLSCPEYPMLFLVESKAMEEARKRGAAIVGTVGRVLEDDEESENTIPMPVRSTRVRLVWVPKH